VKFVTPLPSLFICCAVALSAAGDAMTAELKPATLTAFQKHVEMREKTIQSRRIDGTQFLWTDESAERRKKVQSGQSVIEPVSGETIEIPDGLIHDWVGAVFIPGVTLQQVVSFVQNYDNHKNVYQPEVVGSKLLNRSGNDFKVNLRLLKKKVLTVVLNTEHDVRYFPLDEKRQHSRSYSTKIAEVADAGKPGEHELPPGRDHGFLWRLNSYWRFLERDGGVYVECEAISLTRGVPMGLGWMITPIIRDLPRESLAHTLEKTRSGLGK
jgi:hypothetical protein